MRIAAIQSDTIWESPPANFERLAPRIAEAAAGGPGLVLLPEMFTTGFSMAPDRMAEPEGGPTEEFLREQATAHGIYIGGSYPVATVSGARPYNRFVLVGPKGETAFYDKIHPFGYGGESEHYAAGARTLTMEIDGLRCTAFICYDLRFGDRFWALARDTDAYLVVANWPAERAPHWGTLLRARAIENLAYVVAVNRVGVGGGISYDGGSCVIDPFGETIAEAGDTETVLLADLDPARVATVRAHYPFLEDR
ncbi:MAG TPA: carbon-nitrogen family hydrolase [Acidimicrobiales bacterium]|jgi:predicted amidohydrolase